MLLDRGLVHGESLDRGLKGRTERVQAHDDSFAGLQLVGVLDVESVDLALEPAAVDRFKEAAILDLLQEGQRLLLHRARQ